MMSDAAEDYDQDYESGPFCIHWASPEDCETQCFACGHKCRQHDAYDDSCGASGCACVAFVDQADVKPTTPANPVTACVKPTPPDPVPSLAKQIKRLTASLKRESRSNTKLRDQIIRATRERSALLKAVRCVQSSSRPVDKRALKALTKAFPRWEGWA